MRTSHHSTTKESSGRARHPHHHRFVVEESALDPPLPVASVLEGSWRARDKIHCTPRRLATLLTQGATGDSSSSEQQQHHHHHHHHEDASSTVLCIAGDEYIVVANTVASNVYIYRLVSSPMPLSASSGDDGRTTVAPWAVVSLLDHEDDGDNDKAANANTSPSDAAIVSLMALPFGQSLIYGENCRREEGHIVAFSDDGQGFVIRIRRNDGATKLCTFSTLNFGVTCAAVVPSPGATTTISDDHHLLVGYQTGYIECWKIFRFSTEKILAKLLWRGIYPNSYCIQHMGPLQMEPPEPNSDNHSNNNNNNDAASIDIHNDNDHATNNNGKESSRYLLITVLSPKYTLKTSAMVEVIDLQSMVEDWKHKSDGQDQQHGHLRAISLAGRWVLPGDGMELLNSSTISSGSGGGSHHHHLDDPSENLPRRAHVIPSGGTGSICSLPLANGVALADGTIAMLSSAVQGDEKKGDLRWGIANDYNQLLLPYPAIGCAPVDWDASPSGEASYIPHVACCLRGGSTYLIPFVSPEDTDNTIPVTVFSLDIETHSRYIHGFTAGNLILSPPATSSGTNKDGQHNDNKTHQYQHPLDAPKTTPVLIYGWAGGIIDVYSCELNNSMPCRPMITHNEVSALEELVSNGSTQLLAELLSSLDETDPLLQQQSMWKKAWDESKREGQAASLQEASVQDLLLPKLAGTRTLLLQLSNSFQAVPVG